MLAKFGVFLIRLDRCVATALLGAACMGAQACSPQGGLVGDSVDGKDASAGSQAVDGIGEKGALEGGGRYPMSAAPLVWSEQAQLLASDGAATAFLGRSVSLSGGTSLVGAYHDDAAGSASGSAYVFTRSATTWAQQDKLLAGDGAAFDYFGSSVSLSGDTALVGAYQDDDGGSNSGSAYVFTRSATTWALQQKLLAGDGAADDYFGRSVALSGDTAIVGAYADGDAGFRSGSAHVFVRSGTTWTLQQKLLAGDGAAADWFGLSVSLSGDTAIVGAEGDDDKGSSSGSAYVFARSGTTWDLQDKLLASDGAGADWFGCSVSLSGDTAVVGADGDSDAGSRSGSAYVFVRSATNWTQQDKLLASDGAALDYFGSSVSLSGDMALVGADGNDDAGTSSGSVYVFARNATTWVQQQKPLASDAAERDFFGRSVSLSGDVALVGADGHNGVGNDSGAAYVFALRLSGGQPCSSDAACASDFCVDGFCCESACGGACEACNVAGSEGLCTLAGRGTDPTAGCSGYLCDGASGACPNGCAGDEDCASSHHCPGVLACVPKMVDGQRCDSRNVCLSGYCVDGVCCDGACDEGCGSCVVAGREGACSPLETGAAGTPSCAPYLCDGGIASCPIDCGTHGDCTQDGHCSEGVCLPDSKQGGACSEVEACATGHCTDGVCCDVDACGAYRCGAGGTCETACSSSAQCAAGHECNSDRACEPSVASEDEASDTGACHLAGVSATAHAARPWRGLGGLAWIAALGLLRMRRREGREPSQAPTLPTL